MIDLILVRHGEGEHTLDVPASLEIEHPGLTDKGVRQVEGIRDQIDITDQDLLVVSPTRRTVQTALLLENNQGARRCLTPLVGPRMFPQNPKWSPLPWDKLLTRETLRAEDTEFKFIDHGNLNLWTESINTIGEDRFRTVAVELIEWCKQQDVNRVVFVSHDGTINSYRKLLGESGVTRADFLSDAGWIRITV